MLTKPTYATDHISTIGTGPTDRAMTTQQFKNEFDKTGIDSKEWQADHCDEVDAALALKDNAKIEFVDDTASRNIAASDLRKKLRGSHATVPIIYTILNDTLLTAGVGEWIIIRWEGVVQVSVAAGSGVTLETPDGLKVSARYREIVLTKEGANLWSIGGASKA